MSKLKVFHAVPLRSALAVLWFAAVCAKPAAAQTFPVNQWGPRIMGRVLFSVIRDSMAARRTGTSVLRPETNGGPVGSPTFMPAPERRREGIARRIAAIRDTDPAGAAELTRITAQGDTVAAFAASLRPVGVTAYSVSDAFAAWVTMTWAQLHPAVTPPASMDVVRKQVDRALQGAPAFATATDAEKQEFAEALILHLLANAPRVRAAKGDAAKQAPLFAQLQRAGAEISVDFEHMTYTEQGFMSADMVKPAVRP